MDARIKSGHDGWVLWGEARLMSFAHTNFIRFKQQNESKHDFATPRRATPESLMNLSPRKTEGVGNAGCPLHPRPRVHFVVVERTRVTTSTPESPGIPARNGFTAYVVLSPVTELFCHRRQRICFV
jgi:hypothetical protein